MTRHPFFIPLASLVGSFLVFRIFGFTGGLVVIALVALGWYLLKRNTGAMAALRDGFASRGGGQSGDVPQVDHGRPLSPQEQAEFDGLVDNFQQRGRGTSGGLFGGMFSGEDGTPPSGGKR